MNDLFWVGNGNVFTAGSGNYGQLGCNVDANTENAIIV